MEAQAIKNPAKPNRAWALATHLTTNPPTHPPQKLDTGYNFTAISASIPDYILVVRIKAESKQCPAAQHWGSLLTFSYIWL